MMHQTALITGASRGIGAAAAKAFAQAGYHLALCCQNSALELSRLADELRQTYGTDVLTFLGDVGEPEFIRHMTDTALSHFGFIDVLVNNAGISQIGLLSDMSLEEWNRLMAVNVTSVFCTCQNLIPSMVRRKQGKIINISSVWGSAGASCEAAYSASKGAVNALTRALGKELAPSGIQVNAIAYGVIDTQMNAGFSDEEKKALAEEIPAGRFCSPEEAARFILMLAGSSNYLTGQILTIDGGWT